MHEGSGAEATEPGVPEPATGNALRTVVVVPCYNEAERLEVARFTGFLLREPSVSLLFVDDGSRDATGEVLRDLCGEAGPNASWLALPRNAGKAEAVRQGIQEAIRGGAGIVGYWDADLSTDLGEIVPMRSLLLADPERVAVLGTRVRLLGRNIERSAVRHYLGRVFATAASLVLGLPVYDTQCGAKLFRVSPATAAAFSRPFRSRWAFDVELLSRLEETLGREGVLATMVEHPLAAWTHVGGSKLKPGAMIRAFLDVLSLWWRRRR